MKYTIEGFRQDKLVEMGLDSTDACLLRYILDFYNTGKMIKVNDNGKEYFWLNYQATIDSMPILRIASKDSLYRRLKKMVDGGLLEHFTKKHAGTFSCYRFTEKLEELLSAIIPVDTDEKSEGVRMKSRTGTDEKSEQNMSLLDKSIKKDIYMEKPKKPKKEVKQKKQFTPPTQQQVKDYCEEKKLNIDVFKFMAYYEASNWRNKYDQPVQNWKQTAVTWHKKTDTELKQEAYERDKKKYYGG
jgi:hypothetical protein